MTCISETQSAKIGTFTNVKATRSPRGGWGRALLWGMLLLHEYKFLYIWSLYVSVAIQCCRQDNSEDNITNLTDLLVQGLAIRDNVCRDSV